MTDYTWIEEARNHFKEISEGEPYVKGDEKSEKSKEMNEKLKEWLEEKLKNEDDIILNKSGNKWAVQGHKKLQNYIWYSSYHKDYGGAYPVVFSVSLGKEGLNIGVHIYDNRLKDSDLCNKLGEFITSCPKAEVLKLTELKKNTNSELYFGFSNVSADDIDDYFGKVLQEYKALPKKINKAIFEKMLSLYNEAKTSQHCKISADDEWYTNRLGVKALVDKFTEGEDNLEENFRAFWNREIINSVQQGASAGNVITRNDGIAKVKNKIKKLVQLGKSSPDLVKNVEGLINSSKKSSLELYYLYYMNDDNFPLINGGIENAIKLIKKNGIDLPGENMLEIMSGLKERITREDLKKYYLLDQFLNLIDKIKYEDIKNSGESKELYQLAYLFTFFRKTKQVNNAGFFDKLLEKSKNIILYGAPGTGKTYTSENNIDRIIEIDFPNKDIEPSERFKKVQFHPSYSYEDFMEGLKPMMKNGQVALELKKGDFFNFCETASGYENAYKEADTKDKMSYAFFFLVDEINRAELSRVFGEIMYALDKRGNTISTQYSYLKEGNATFSIPENVYFIGTMNDVDRSIDSFDIALRRRFFWYRMDCNYAVIKEDSNLRQFENIGALDDNNKPKTGYLKACYALNQHITGKGSDGLGLGQLYELGHSYFMNINVHAKGKKITNANLKDLFDFSVAPLLKEYIRTECSEDMIEGKIEEAKKKFKFND